MHCLNFDFLKLWVLKGSEKHWKFKFLINDAKTSKNRNTSLKVDFSTEKMNQFQDVFQRKSRETGKTLSASR